LDPGNGQVLQTITIATTRTLGGLAIGPQVVGVEPTSWGRTKETYR
jgi:hypothetical protein